jgi:putative transcriptional regulator
MHRADHGVNQAALADAVGVSRQTISAIEQGDYNPSVKLALRMADYFGLDVEDLFQL